MNWLDFILIAVNATLIIMGIILIPLAIRKSKSDMWSDMPMIAIAYWGLYICIGWLLWLPFIVLDRGSGSTIGTITSVDKNFFGTTALYIKTSETTQEKYCIEFNEELEEEAKELIGKEVKISYGTRVGLYSTSKCHQAPVEDIQLIED